MKSYNAPSTIAPSARIHSIETMGLMDGPGVRTVFFLQGCPLRCVYCHNPDSQAMDAGEVMTTDDVIAMAKRYKPYYRREGGVTFSGGEPLMQAAFLSEILPRLQAEGIHTCLDTSGYGPIQNLDKILAHTDLLLLDIKQMDDWGYRQVAGVSMQGYKQFVQAIIKHFHGKIWLRHVMVPGWTDNQESMDGLWEQAEVLLPWIERIEILPYHKLGEDKYTDMGIKYRLKQVPAMDRERALAFEQELMGRLDNARSQLG